MSTDKVQILVSCAVNAPLEISYAKPYSLAQELRLIVQRPFRIGITSVCTSVVFFLMLAITPVMGQNLSLGSVDFIQEIAGKKLVFPVDLSLGLRTTSEGVEISVMSDMNLKNLQDNFDVIVKAVPTPRDNCAKYAAGNIVAGVTAGVLESEKDTARIKIKMGVAIWDCREGLPSSTVRWRRPCRFCPPIPQITVHRGSDIKNRLWTDDVDGRLALTLKSPDGKSLALESNGVKISPRSDPASYINTIFEFFGNGLSRLATAEISKYVADGSFRQTLPISLAKYEPKITSADFATAQDGSLHARVSFQAKLSGDQLAGLVQEALVRRP